MLNEVGTLEELKKINMEKGTALGRKRELFENIKAAVNDKLVLLTRKENLLLQRE